MLILEDELFVELYTTSSMSDAFCLPGAAVTCLLHIVPPGHQRNRKSQKIAFLFANLCCFH